jgi:hypothetical protein
MGKQQQQRTTDLASREYQAVPLLPTTTSSSSSPDTQHTGDESSQTKDTRDGATTTDNVTTMEDDLESDAPVARPVSLSDRILSDPRFRVVVFLVSVGLLNRLT